MLLPRPTESSFELPESGSYAARCVRFLDLGTQSNEWQGVTRLVHQIRISWELPTELMTKGEFSGKPFMVHKNFTWSMSPKSTLKKVLEAWRGKPFTDADFGTFDTRKLIGVPCMIGITSFEKDGKKRSNISNVSPMIKGMVLPDQISESIYFSFDETMAMPKDQGKVVMETILSKLSQGTREVLTRTPEYKKLMGINGDEHAPSETTEDGTEESSGVPF